MAKGVLVDLTKCIGCRGCQVSCKEWNGLPGTKTVMTGDLTNPPQLNARCFTNIRFVEDETSDAPVWTFVKDQCLHCKNPACASVCPVGALRKTEAGPVTYTFERCIGCRYCMLACPFYIPKYEWFKASEPWVRKCTFCSDRIGAGLVPLCVKSCPTGTLKFGDRDELLKEAEARLAASPDRYVNHIYGKEEAGGTSWMYLSALPFASLGFDVKIPNRELPELTWAYISKIPAVIGVVLAAGAAAWAITRRSASAGKEDSHE
ncbi:MAG: 4Fe-4S dicluster domain-containing protein [Thermodesulfovibrionales bacterium]